MYWSFLERGYHFLKEYDQKEVNTLSEQAMGTSLALTGLDIYGVGAFLHHLGYFFDEQKKLQNNLLPRESSLAVGCKFWMRDMLNSRRAQESTSQRIHHFHSFPKISPLRTNIRQRTSALSPLRFYHHPAASPLQLFASILSLQTSNLLSM